MSQFWQEKSTVNSLFNPYAVLHNSLSVLAITYLSQSFLRPTRMYTPPNKNPSA